MDINAAFPSDFLKAADLQDRPHILAMSNVQMEKVGDDTKPCVYFQGKQRGLLLNKTNANTISAIYGTNTEGWMGQNIEIFPTTTDFQGKLVDCIRVRPAGVNVGSPAYQGGVQTAPVTNQTQPAAQPKQEYVAGTPGNVGDTTLDDEIPF